MKAPLRPATEARRLAKLRQYHVLDTLPEQALDDLTMLASHLCEAPIALISFLDEERQWFKSKVGWSAAATPRDHSFCGHAILQPEMFIVPDATQDERFADNPLVTGAARINFYAGVPLITADGHALGTLCVMDRGPRQLTPAQQEALRALGRQVMAQLELRRQTHELIGSNARLRAIFNADQECVHLLAADGSLIEMNPAGLRMIEATSLEQVKNQIVYPLVAAEHRAAFRELTEKVFRGESGTLEFAIVGLQGGGRWLETHATPLLDEAGRVTALLGITRDITPRRHAEATLMEERRLLRTLIDHLPGHIYIKDRQGRYLLVNQPSVVFFGVAGEAELLGKTVFDLFPPEIAAPFAADDRSVLATGMPVLNREEPYAVGERRGWFATTNLPLRDADGKLTGLVGITLDITERKKSEEALRASEARHRGVTQCLNEGLLLTDLDDVIVEVNPQMLQMTGYAREELLGRRATDLFVPAVDRAPMRLRRPERAGGGEHYEQRLRRKDGTEFWALIASSPLRDAHGQVVGTVAANLDISERKRAEQRLAAFASLGQRLNTASDVSTACRLMVEVADELFGWDACLLVLYDASTRLCRTVFNMDVVNGQRAEVPATYLDQAPSPRLRQVIDTGAELILREEPVGGSPDLVPFGERSRPSASLMFVPLRDGQKIIGVLSIQSYRLHAYTQADLGPLQALADHCGGALERIYSRESQRESEAKYRLLIERMGEGLVQVDANDCIRFVNPQILRLLGYSETELLGQPAGTLLCHEADRRKMTERHAQRSQGLAEGYEVQLRTKSGESFWAWISATPLMTAEGRFSGSMAIITDITERKRADAERQKLEAQLRQAQKMEAIGTLAGGIAHDFNNVLGAIIGNAELAAMDVGSDHAALESLREIRKACARAKGLVAQILSFSRQDVRETDVVNLRYALEDGVRFLRATLPAHVEFNLQFGEEIPNIRANLTEIHQVLTNLGTNAWHAMEGRPGRITFRLENVAVDVAQARAQADLRPGPYARLTVSDTGKGMDAATLERIFDPFFTTKEVGQGTGLGLSVVHGIMKHHQGAILVASQPGQGTTFELYFPAAASAISDDQAPSAPAALPRGQGQHVLYLDDEEPLVILITRLLERLGYRVTGFTRATDALAALEAGPGAFDILVTDYNMPGASGLDVARATAKLRSDLPVLLASGFITDDLRAKAAQAGVRQVLYKPNTVEELCASIHHLLQSTKRP